MTTIATSHDNGVLTITLNRPDRGNAIDMALAQALLDAVLLASDDPQVRCVVLTGAGRMFCAGGDISAFIAAGEAPGTFIRTLADVLHEAMIELARMEKPLVALVNGPAAGAGLSLAMAADIVLASEAAHFTAAYTAIGLTPDGGLTWLLPRLVGLRKAQEMILTNRRVHASEAYETGMVTRVVAAEQLADEGRKHASQLADGPTAALGAARRLLAEGQLAALRQQLDSEAASIATLAGSPEGREGLVAFSQRRPPDFRSL